MRRRMLILRAGALLVATASACAPSVPAPAPESGTTPTVIVPGGAAARADSVRESYNQADIDFMTGMIHHHAQAVVMARMAPTHGASAALRIMAARIINAQIDEIALMQRWLRDRGQPVPDPDDEAHAMHHAMHMAGMLTPEQLAALDAARGEDFDRLFLTYMIQHHQGALTMVNELFATYGAAQGDATFKIASDIGADQSSEIDRMQSMLRDLVFDAATR